MKIIVQNGHDIATETQIDELMRAVYLIADGWHDWAGPDPADSGLAAYFEDRPRDRELLEKSYVKSAGYQSDQKTVRIDCSQGASNWFFSENNEIVIPLTIAHRYLKQPLSIVVENSRADGAFLKQYIDVLDTDLAARISSPDSGISIFHAGGKAEMAMQLEVWLGESTSPNYPKRMLLIFDSDAKFSGHTTSDTNKLARLCETQRIPFHVLHRRAIENYVTDKCLQAYADYAPDLSDAVAFIIGLDPDQRYYYPFKVGCPVDSEIPQQRLLYENTDVSHGAYSMARIADYMLFRSEVVLSRPDLVQNGSINEIQEIATKIKKEI